MAALSTSAVTALGFLLGAVLAAILIRRPQVGGARTARGQCRSCGHGPDTRAFVPILSWWLVAPRCGHCGAPTERRLLGLEAGAVLVGLTAILAHPLPAALFTALLGWWLFFLAARDMRGLALTHRYTVPLIAAGLAVGWAGVGPPLDSRAIGAVAGYGAMAGIGWAWRRFRGDDDGDGGEGALFAAIGAWLGWRPLPVVLLVAAAIGACVLAIGRVRGSRRRVEIPLAALLALAAWPVWLVVALPGFARP